MLLILAIAEYAAGEPALYNPPPWQTVDSKRFPKSGN